MSTKTNLGFAAFALLAFLVAGTAYWGLRESSPLGAPSGSDGAPAPPAPPASQSASTAPQSEATAPQSQATAPQSQATTPQSQATAPQSQATAPSAPTPAPPNPASNKPAASPSPAPAPLANAESSAPSAATAPAPRTTLPSDNQMSEADRRQIQGMLQGMKFYQGPIDGKFGPLTRAAIRRYQDSIGAKSTGYLTAEEATRLASTR
jgi:hypothetical protein